MKQDGDNQLRYDFTKYDVLNTVQSLLNSYYKGGSLAYFLGAGLSKSASHQFPDWASLVQRLLKLAELPCSEDEIYRYNSAGEKISPDYTALLKLADKVKKKEGDNFVNILKEALYKDVKYDIHAISNETMVALGRLIIGSTNKGYVEIVNYNYDDSLEWYLEYYGFSLQLVTDLLPINHSCQVRISHPHGFVPLLDKNRQFACNELILTESSYEKRIVDVDHPYSILQKYLMQSYLCVFIGISFEDRLMKTLAKEVYEKILKRKRLLGVILTREAHELDKDEYLEHGIVVYPYKNHEDLAPLLSSISSY